METLKPSFATTSPKLKDHPLSLSKKIWADKTVTWKLESDSPSIEGRNIELEIFRRVFTQIGLYAPNRIVQLNKSTADADIRINFTKTDPYWVSMPSVLAYAYPPQNGIGGDITFNTKSYIWTPDGAPMPVTKAYDMGLIPGFTDPKNTIKTFKLPHTAVHEGLHAMGVPHIEKAACPGAMMNPIYNGEILMQKCDIDYLQSLYGTVNLGQTQIDEMKGRFTAPYE
jgi:hypothetical protein